MKKINSKVLSIPPYISTSWENVISLQIDESSGNLIVSLKTGNKISIPYLPGTTLEEIFNAHSEYVELQEKMQKPTILLPDNNSIGIGLIPWHGKGPDMASPMGDLSSLQSMMQHDPKQKDLPDLPAAVIDRIKQTAKLMDVNFEALGLPESEPHCNCPYCQVIRAMKGSDSSTKEPPVQEQEEEIVQDSDLKFQDWRIKQLEGNLYEVSSILDPKEVYTVYLGSPIGCTCGKDHCEHIRAVLNS